MCDRTVNHWNWELIGVLSALGLLYGVLAWSVL